MIDVSRREIKYQISPHEIAGLKRRLASIMRCDRHNGRDGYLVRSLYFDTPFDTDYEDKIDGYNERQKIRLRLYDPQEDTVKLELKEKKGTVQRKRSLILNREEAEQMICGIDFCKTAMRSWRCGFILLWSQSAIGPSALWSTTGLPIIWSTTIRGSRLTLDCVPGRQITISLTRIWCCIRSEVLWKILWK